MAKVPVTIVDYGLGNLFSIGQAIESFGNPVIVTGDPSAIESASTLVLPGVGAFGTAMRNLVSMDLVSPITDYARSERPMLGICLGMQLLFSKSDEFGSHSGLNLVPGSVVRFPSLDTHGQPLRVPNIGWSEVRAPSNHAGTAGRYMYFVHSFHAVPERDDVIAEVSHHGGYEFCAAIQQNNLTGTQYHPEKSGPSGLQVLNRWLKDSA